MVGHFSSPTRCLWRKILEIINLKDKKYVVRLKTPDIGYSASHLQWFKEYRNSDTVLKKDGLLYFVDQMIDIDFEDILDDIPAEKISENS